MKHNNLLSMQKNKDTITLKSETLNKMTTVHTLTCDGGADPSETGLEASDDDLGMGRVVSERAGQEMAPPMTEAGSTTPFTGLFQTGLLGPPALLSPLFSELSGWGSEPELSIKVFSEAVASSTGGEVEAPGGAAVAEAAAAAAAVGDEFCSESPRTTEAQGEWRLRRRDWGLLTPPPLATTSAVGGEPSVTIQERMKDETKSIPNPKPKANREIGIPCVKTKCVCVKASIYTY